MGQAQGTLTVSRVSGGQVGGGTAVDDGVRGQVGEPGQGCHKGRGVCSGRTTTLNAAALEQVPVVPLLPGKPAQPESSIAGTAPGSR